MKQESKNNKKYECTSENAGMLLEFAFCVKVMVFFVLLHSAIFKLKSLIFL